MKDKPADIKELLVAESIAAYRNKIIEECAQRVLSWSIPRGYNMNVAAELVAAIRTLKDIDYV